VLSRVRSIIFASLLLSSTLFGADYEEVVYSEELYSAPVQGVRTSVSPLVFATVIGAIVGVSAIILSTSDDASTHFFHND